MRVLILAAALATILAGPAHAWGPAGHRWVSGIAAENLPAELPAFLRAKKNVAMIAEFGNEPDRSRGSGRTHDHDRDAGHFVDLTDDGKVLGGVAFETLPETRWEYDTALRAGGSDQYKSGYATYAIIDGFQQLAKDFAYYRAAVIGEKRAATAADRAWFKEDKRQREALIIRDLGIWSHYVGDITQPQHTSIHYDGWGNYPNPNNYPMARFHVRWENQFVQFNVKRAAVAASVPAFRDCACTIQQRTRDYVLASFAEVTALHLLEGKAAFPDKAGDPADPVLAEQIAFGTKQLALAAAEIRDMTVMAWRASTAQGVGYPVIPLADIESGKVVLTRQMLGGE